MKPKYNFISLVMDQIKSKSRFKALRTLAQRKNISLTEAKKYQALKIVEKQNVQTKP